MKQIKALQYFTDEYLEECRKMTPLQILRYLEDFRMMHVDEGKSITISIRIPERLLAGFKRRCEQLGTPYQSKIKLLMREWIVSDEGFEEPK